MAEVQIKCRVLVLLNGERDPDIIKLAALGLTSEFQTGDGEFTAGLP